MRYDMNILRQDVCIIDKPFARIFGGGVRGIAEIREQVARKLHRNVGQVKRVKNRRSSITLKFARE